MKKEFFRKVLQFSWLILIALSVIGIIGYSMFLSIEGGLMDTFEGVFRFFLMILLTLSVSGLSFVLKYNILDDTILEFLESDERIKLIDQVSTILLLVGITSVNLFVLVLFSIVLYADNIFFDKLITDMGVIALIGYMVIDLIITIKICFSNHKIGILFRKRRNLS